MTLWNKLFKKEAPREYVMKSSIERAMEAQPMEAVIASRSVQYLPPVLLQRGKWVNFQDRIGIVTDVSNAAYIVIDFVDANGITVETGKAPPGLVRLAKLMEIPALRRPDSAVGQSLGYF